MVGVCGFVGVFGLSQNRVGVDTGVTDRGGSVALIRFVLFSVLSGERGTASGGDYDRGEVKLEDDGKLNSGNVERNSAPLSLWSQPAATHK